jgi:hypothetical protein
VSTIKTRTVGRRNRLSSNANETIVVERTDRRRNRLASNANETIVAS